MSKEKMLNKVKRALELQAEMAKLNAELKKAKAEYSEIMDDPYIYDKVVGLKYNGIL